MKRADGGKLGFCCPQCGARMSVKESRQAAVAGQRTLRRRRECPRCRYRLSTVEVVWPFPDGLLALRARLLLLSPLVTKLTEHLDTVLGDPTSGEGA